MSKRTAILLGMAAGLAWAVALLVLGGTRGGFAPPAIAFPGAVFAPGLVMILMIGRLAQRRFFDDTVIDGEAFPPGSPGWVDQRVLANTVEQAVLAGLIWPFAALTLGGQVVLYLGFGFAVARLAFWYGYHRAPPLRAFGFAATFYPTALVAVWTLVAWM